MIRSQPQLTHFRFNYLLGELFSKDPLLIEIINIFRASADLKMLCFDDIADCNKQRVEVLLTEDANRIIVEKDVETGRKCNLKLVKKSQVRYSFEKFNNWPF